MTADRGFRTVRVRALGKINVMLRVLGVRADGFHERCQNRYARDVSLG